MTTDKVNTVKLVPSVPGFLVVCVDCGRELGKVPTKRAAYCRVGEFIHDCHGAADTSEKAKKEYVESKLSLSIYDPRAMRLF